MKTKEIEVKSFKTVKYVEVQDFVDFLKRRGALRSYVSNLIAENPKYATRPFDFVKEQSVRIAVSGAFIWEKTPEGQKYWQSISKGWEDFLKDEDIQVGTIPPFTEDWADNWIEE